MTDADVIPLEISSEQERTYHYADGKSFTIAKPTYLYVLESGSHRVIAEGRTYRPERGWIAISWLPEAECPAFVA